MGMFKGLKQMKEAVAGAPGLIDQAQQLQTAALQQQAAAQQQAAMAAGVPAGGIGQGITPAPTTCGRFPARLRTTSLTAASVSRDAVPFPIAMSSTP